jgi:hypothetical protein
LRSISAKLQEPATPLCVFERSFEQQLTSPTSGVETLPACSELLALLEVFEQWFATFSEQHAVSRAVPEVAPVADESQQPASSSLSCFPSFAMSV